MIARFEWDGWSELGIEGFEVGLSGWRTSEPPATYDIPIWMLSSLRFNLDPNRWQKSAAGIIREVQMWQPMKVPKGLGTIRDNLEVGRFKEHMKRPQATSNRCFPSDHHFP